MSWGEWTVSGITLSMQRGGPLSHIKQFPEEGLHSVANRRIAQPLSGSMGLKSCGSDDQG